MKSVGGGDGYAPGPELSIPYVDFRCSEDRGITTSIAGLGGA